MQKREINGDKMPQWLASPFLWSPLLTILSVMSPGVYMRGARWYAATLSEVAIDGFGRRFDNVFLFGSVFWFAAMSFALLAFLWAMEKRMRRQMRCYSIPLFVGCAGFLVFPFFIDFSAKEETALPVIVRNAEPVMNALEHFKSDYGYYPKQLEQLVPAYLPLLPKPGILGETAFDYQYPCDYPAGYPNMYKLKVYFGIEDSFYYLSDEKARAALLGRAPSVYQQHDRGWIFEDT